MKIINQYIIKTLFNYILTVALVWFVIFAFFDFLADIDNIGVGAYSIFDSLYIIILNFPIIIYKKIIIIILIGVVLALGHLASTSELIIARSTGTSIIAIAKITTIFALIFMLIITIFGELVAPNIIKYTTNYREKLLTNTTVQSINQNFWLKNGSYIFNIKKNYGNNNFADVTIFNLEDTKLLQTIKAKRMVVKNKKAILGDVDIYQIHPNNKINYTYHKNYIINLLFNKKIIQTLKKKPSDLSIIDIYHQIKFLQKNNLNSNVFLVELYQRLIKPLLLITTILFAMLFIFGSLRDTSMGKKLFLAVSISLVLELYLRISEVIALKFDYNYVYIVVLPIIITLMIILNLLIKKR